ncbi:MAG: hypothetical protein WED00_19230 [Aquisalimonadaceae bacterium]
MTHAQMELLTESPIRSDNGKGDITQHEIEALKTRFNLADAHTHQTQSASQQEIISSLPDLWYRAESLTQYQIEQEFINVFYRFNGQHAALKRKEQIYLVYAASIGMHITSTYLMKNRMQVGLIEPCFDNLHDLMEHMQVPMFPLDESLFQDSRFVYNNLMQHALDLDAIILVDPNNPTGFSIFNEGCDAFREVVRFCQDFNKVLILDLCFAPFIVASGGRRVDIYNILENSGVRYIAMEDTGKIWPMQDAKCATIMASRDLNDEIYKIVTSVLLNVSPFILNIVTRYVRDSSQDGFASVREVLDTNRDCARRYLDSGLLTYLEPMVRTSVAWFQITDPAVSADDLHEYLLQRQVYVLPGKFFYWHNPERGQRYIRIALARNPVLFEQAMNAASEALENYHD